VIERGPGALTRSQYETRLTNEAAIGKYYSSVKTHTRVSVGRECQCKMGRGNSAQCEFAQRFGSGSADEDPARECGALPTKDSGQSGDSWRGQPVLGKGRNLCPRRGTKSLDPPARFWCVTPPSY